MPTANRAAFVRRKTRQEFRENAHVADPERIECAYQLAVPERRRRYRRYRHCRRPWLTGHACALCHSLLLRLAEVNLESAHVQVRCCVPSPRCACTALMFARQAKHLSSLKSDPFYHTL